MALEFQGHLLNHLLINAYSKAEAEINCLGNLAVLANEEDIVVQLIEAAKVPLQDLVEATMILDPDIEPEITLIPDEDAELGIVELDLAYLELNKEEKSI